MEPKLNQKLLVEKVLDLGIRKRDDWAYTIYKTGVACSSRNQFGQGREEIIYWFSPEIVKLIEEKSDGAGNEDRKFFIDENGFLSFQTMVEDDI